jgi:hypothetical protein
MHRINRKHTRKRKRIEPGNKDSSRTLETSRAAIETKTDVEINTEELNEIFLWAEILPL